MKTHKIIIFTTLLLTITTVYGQTYEPLDLAKKICSKVTLPNIENYVAGEYEGKPNGKDLPDGSITKFTLLGQTDKTAVVGMTVLDSIGKGFDTYLHFEKDKSWKMTAFRGLAMTGLIEQIKIELENMTPQQVDEIIEKSKKNKNDDFEMFKSREDYNFQLGNTRLTLELDENIINHFLTNQAEFDRLKNLALIELEKEKVDEDRSLELIETSKPEFNKLFISSVATGGYELGNCINFLIGGMLDNSVGYFYIKDKKDLPEMNPNRIIMIREIANGWYIYKTT
ncbi:hypothetical protein H1R16_00625 [Marnyiella aurantia]|uniref:Uncharacterized protein n=1 Tax=Marnyiella aurantia TaxID=2758037 RepID=A0A7D7QYU6_9FLAO|nr:hypothetical protein [Marnyiella aurantia]MBA5246058.1 hypothetical protein [Marnyiella aurantia]QMS98551.1 hypothetical protein H1R16_00625 [Marnyiella aurantia]